MVSHCMSQSMRGSHPERSGELELDRVSGGRFLSRFSGRDHMIRLIGLFLVLASALAQPAYGLGLGEIDTRSALNERFVAEIELLDTRGLDQTEVIASLASAEDFERVGVERFYFLTDLKFEVVPNARGRLVILATSNNPVTEPYLNFLVEVLWPSGRLLKEYTVLLDPPTFTGTTAAPVAAPTRTESTVAAQTPRANSASGQVNLPSQGATQSRVKVQNFASGTITTSTSDTMWSIGNRTLPSNDVTVQQNMLAIQRENPEAFINDNINLLKAGQVLKLPSPEEIAALTKGQAEAELERQNDEWRAGTPRRRPRNEAVADATDAPVEKLQAQIDATDAAPVASESTDGSSAAGVLQIVAADSNSAGTAETTGAGDEEGTALTTAERDRLAALARQVDELNYQLDQKRAEAEKLQEAEKLISVKDEQISNLQQALKEAQSQAAQAPAKAAAEPKPLWQQPWVLIAGLGTLALLFAGFMFRRRGEEQFEFEDSDVAQEPSFELGEPEVDRSMTTQVLLDEDLDLSEVANANLTEELAATIDGDAAGGEAASLDDDDDLFGADPAGADGAAAGMDSQQTGDVISEADIYIAYGRYPQAIALLLGSIEEDPGQHDVRLRLAEVYAETKDVEGFTEHANYLSSNCDDASIRESVAELRSTLGVEEASDDLSATDIVAAAGTTSLLADADEVIDAGETDATELVAPDSDVLDLDDTPLEFELSDTDTDADAESDSALDTDIEFELSSLDEMTDEAGDEAGEVEADASVELDASTTVDDFELELDLDADADSQDDLGGDLGIEFSTDTTEMLSATTGADDDQLLDEIERSLDELDAEGGIDSSDLDDDGDFSFSDDSDTSATKLDLARAYIDMGDDDGAREILDEVIAEGDNTQKSEANELLGKL